MKSDAAQLTELEAVTKLYLDKAGDVKVNEKSVSDGGTVLGLKKGKTVTCEFYTGTYYQDFNLTANIHSFSSMERFVSYDYEFMHSSFIVIDIPEYLKSGYYFVNGVGLFRYVSDEDAATYNGEAYYTVFGKKIGANAKEKMTKTVYNRTIKVNRIMDGIPYNVKKEYVKEFKEYFEEQVERIISEYFE